MNECASLPCPHGAQSCQRESSVANFTNGHLSCDGVAIVTPPGGGPAVLEVPKALRTATPGPNPHPARPTCTQTHGAQLSEPQFTCLENGIKLCQSEGHVVSQNLSLALVFELCIPQHLPVLFLFN